ncbi:MAG: glycosyltransferase [Gemmatimonadaceae bacterium]
MRILVVGSQQWWRMESGVQRALRRAGHETLLLNDRVLRQYLGRSLAQRVVRLAARRFRPDFVFLGKCLGLTLETVAELVRGRRSALWYLDAPYYAVPERADIAHTIGAGRLADVFFVSGFEAEWRKLGLNAVFLPAAADRDIVPAAPQPAYAADLTFTGSSYDTARAEFLVALSRRFRVKVWGDDWAAWRDRLDWGGRKVVEREFAAVCSSSAIMLGLLPGVARAATTYASDRMWVTGLAGGFYLGQGSPGVDRLLLDGVHCAWFTDFDSCVRQAERYLAAPGEREDIRRRGEAFMRRHHTFDERVPHLLAGTEWVNPLS